MTGKKNYPGDSTNGLGSAEDIGAVLKAGANCGSCVPELKRLLTQFSASSI